VLVFALGAACGGGGGEKTTGRARAAGRGRVTTARPGSTTTTTTTPTTPSTDTGKPVARPASDGVSPPAVVDRGTDSVAVARSLAEYGRWLEWHDPDPALVDRAYTSGSELANNMVRTVVEMRRVRKRVQEVDRAPLDFVVVSELANVVSFRVTERLARRDVVDLAGHTLRHAGPAIERYVVIMMRPETDAAWRLLTVERRGPPIEVRL
jgi:hypothetical protein